MLFIWREMAGQFAGVHPRSPRHLDEAKRFGVLLARQRKERGLTQARLAEAADLHPNAVGQIERGRLVPSLVTLLALARGLDLPLAIMIADLEADLRGRETPA